MEKSVKIITISITLITIVVVSVVFKYASAIFLPLIVAVLLSYIFSPVVKVFEKIKIPRLIAILLVLLLFAGIITLIGNFLYLSIESFAKKFDKYQQTFVMLFNDLSEKSIVLLEKMNIDVEDNEVFSLRAVLESINWKNSISNITAKFATFASSFSVVMLFLVFLLLEKPLLKKKLFMIYSGEKRERALKVFNDINDQVVKYLGLKFVVSFATGIISYLLLALIGLDFAGLWGFLAFLLNFIPSIGSLFVIIIVTFMGLVQFGAVGDWGRFVAVAVAINGTQFIIGNFIDPRLQGQKLNLSPIIILFSLFFWGWIWGVVGMFLAVPLMVIIKIVIETIPGLEHFGVMMGSGQEPKQRKCGRLGCRFDEYKLAAMNKVKSVFHKSPKKEKEEDLKKENIEKKSEENKE
ncbi:MAG: AI-2E family transporter [Spirochaetales bacterium]|nr:AI-2E family transporter [Spirochaetales bacterium]